MKYRVWGHVNVPNQFEIEVEAESSQEAINKASVNLNMPGSNPPAHHCIVPQSQDECSASDYYPLEANPV